MKNKNFLKKRPVIKQDLNWSIDANGAVILERQNKGLAHRIAQKVLNKPRISYIHLDQFGSFIWQQIDGKHDIIAIGELTLEHFGQKVEPLYERLAEYFKILEDYGFITLTE